MRTSLISIGVLTLIFVIGVSQRAMPLEKAIVPLAEPNINAGSEVLLSAVDVGALQVSPGCDTIGGFAPPAFGFTEVYRGNRILITDTSELTRLEMDLQFFDFAELHFTVHEQCDDGDLFEKVGESIVLHQGNEEGDFTLRTYSSDVFEPPIQLFADCTYAFGVAWNEFVIFVNDDVNYPTVNDGFPDGDVLGGTHISQGPPVPDMVNFPSDSFAYLMHFCLAPKPGACCLGPGICENLTQLDCEAAFGTFTAERFLCDDESIGPKEELCPLAVGGCCLPDDGGCFDLNQFACENEANAGTWNADACSTDPCSPRGACCRDNPTATCTEETEEACAEAEIGDTGGIYQGDDTNCTEDGLFCNTGACCSGESCAELTDAECAANPGVWQKSGSRCEADTCDPPGACCLGDDTCEDELDGMNLARCEAAGGVYQGEFSICDDTQPDACGRGACCAQGIGCIDLTQQQCEQSVGGTFGGSGTACATLDPPCPGTCCWDFGCLPNETPASCSAFPGGFFGGYVECGSDPDPCPANPEVGCCLDDGTCIETSTAGCDALDGAPDASLTCANIACVDTTVRGACCLLDGRCAEVTKAACTSAGGTFPVDPFVEFCTVEFCVVGVCCHDDRSCDELTDLEKTIADCSADSDNFYAGRKTCDVCPPSGACCFPDDPCDDRTQASCEAEGGSYGGDSTACTDDDVCKLGACCRDNGECDNTISAACTTGYNSEVLCAAASCPAAEACCLPDGSCDLLTPTACGDLEGGETQANVTSCTADMCTYGACCVPGEPGVSLTTCVSDLTELECDARNGSHRGPREECLDGGHCTEGVCCFFGEDCNDILTVKACGDLEGGVHQGIDTTCDDTDLCTEGACCLGGGDCESLTRANCAANNTGIYQGTGVLCDECTRTACCAPGECIFGRTETECAALNGSPLGFDMDGDPISCNFQACAVGACCLEDGTCSDTVFKAHCADPDNNFREGEDCSALTQPCAAAGACCDTNDNCAPRTAAACNGLNPPGVYFGDGVLCNGGDCPGACCDEDGTCRATTLDVCEGDFDSGNTCDPLACGGSCCRMDGTCNFVLEDRCVEERGEIFVPGQACIDTVCEVRGACCQGGDCTAQTVDNCGGYYIGDGSLCADVNCNLGGCCRFDDGACESDMVEAQCEGPYDIFDEIGCGKFPCVPLAACCVTDEPCQVLTEAQCDLLADIDQGIESEFGVPGTDCDATTCSIAPCCMEPNRTCAEAQQIVCERDGGAVPGATPACDGTCHVDLLPCETADDCNENFCRLEGTNCIGNQDCQMPDDTCVGSQFCVSTICTQGACCSGDGSCENDAYAFECDEDTDEFFPFLRCFELDPVCAEKRACCIDGGCSLETRDDCVKGGGTFSSNVADCRPGLCEIGACCELDDETCQDDVSGQVCENRGDSFQGAGTSCEAGTLCHACCTGDEGSCVNTISTVCAELLGTYAATTYCSPITPNPCVGACCANGQCTIIDVNDADTVCADGYRGNGSSCEPGLCDLGACCDREGDCANRVIESDCAEASLFFHLGVDCDSVACDPYRACCENGQCRLTTEADCFGVFQSDMTTCDDVDLCVTGGCCGIDGVCDDGFVASQCLDPGDEHSPDTLCADITCEPKGACCEGGTCTLETANGCAGIYQGDETLCDSSICIIGGCCGIDGVCDDVVASQCLDPGDEFSSGTLCTDITCEPKGACCEGGTCTLETANGCAGIYLGDETPCDSSICVIGGCCGTDGVCDDGFIASQCLDTGDEFSPSTLCSGIVCEPPPPCSMADLTGIVFADDQPIPPLPFDQPGHCAIDAREPHGINDATAQNGWDRMVMSFSCDPTAIGLAAKDFVVSGVPAGVVPSVKTIDPNNVANTATVMLNANITPGQWTCIAHAASGNQWCMGYLPADAGQDGVSAGGDITVLINAINLVPGLELPMYATDIDRSGLTAGQDILRLIDLLNGAGDFDQWITQSLPSCPTP